MTVTPVSKNVIELCSVGIFVVELVMAVLSVMGVECVAW